MREDTKTQQFKRRIYQYVLRLIKFLCKLPNDPVLVELKKQLTKSGTSVGANYFEAIAGSSRKDFVNFFTQALKSANESKFWLALIRDSGMIGSSFLPECNELLIETKEIANIFASSIPNAERKEKQTISVSRFFAY